MSQTTDFYRIQKLPPYVFAVINEMKAKARAANMDVVDLGMGNPDGPNHNVDLDPEKEAIVTMGAKDALAHLLFAIVGPGDVVASPNPAYPIHQYGVIMSEGHACTLPMPHPGTFLNALEHLYRI